MVQVRVPIAVHRMAVIVAATNHAGLLDRALFRRFDLAIEYPLPGAAEIISLLQSRLATLDTGDVDWSKVAGAAAGLSQAELVRSASQVANRAVLANRKRSAASLPTGMSFVRVDLAAPPL